MADVFQKTFPNVFSWTKIIAFYQHATDVCLWWFNWQCAGTKSGYGLVLHTWQPIIAMTAQFTVVFVARFQTKTVDNHMEQNMPVISIFIESLPNLHLQWPVSIYNQMSFPCVWYNVSVIVTIYCYMIEPVLEACITRSSIVWVNYLVRGLVYTHLVQMRSKGKHFVSFFRTFVRRPLGLCWKHFDPPKWSPWQ